MTNSQNKQAVLKLIVLFFAAKEIEVAKKIFRKMDDTLTIGRYPDESFQLLLDISMTWKEDIMEYLEALETESVDREIIHRTYIALRGLIDLRDFVEED
jgi:DNA polymerase elongation subunit (family B)